MLDDIPQDRPLPQVVELYGLPGAGKTTVTQALRAPSRWTTREQVSAAWRALPVRRRITYLMRAICDFRWMRTVLSLAREAPLKRMESFGRLLRLAVTKPWLRSLEGTMLLDQGLMQRLWSIFYTEEIGDPPERLLSRLLAEYYRGLAVCIVTIAVPPETAAKRVHQRDIGHSRLDELPEQAVLARLRSTGALTEAIARAASDAGLRVITLDGTAEPSDLARQLEVVLDSLGTSSPDADLARGVSLSAA